MSDPLPPGSVIGILGGGQLGRMLSVAASRLGLRCHIYEPSPNPPAGQVAEWVTTAGYDDEAALSAFADAVDLVTYEFENVPTAALDLIENKVTIRPGRRALAISQDRITEKDFLSGLGLSVAPYAQIDTETDLETALADIGTPSILKTRRMGYDGKGQQRLTGGENLASVVAATGNAPCVLEGFVDFEREISVIGARSTDGQVVCYDPGENVHQGGILHTTTVPAAIPASLKQDAVLITGRILNALDYVGVMGVEMFVTTSGLMINEIGPRVHNSGHWTQNACEVDQFEQHIRAVAGWPLGNGTRHSDAVMTNLIGDDASAWQNAPAGLHLYGKAEARPGRKMGHINRISLKG